MTEPENNTNIPRHIAIIMDGNGRWANQRNLPRSSGHRAGVKALKTIVEYSGQIRVDYLTVFAFSSENWQRPQKEVRMLMDLFITSLRDEVEELHKNNVRLSFIGNREAFPSKLKQSIDASESLTRDNNGLHLIIAANYGGRWDITRACKGIMAKVARGELNASDIDESLIADHLCLKDAPDPDLFIRTGGEQRVSNFLLWQCAYSELYFCEQLWPDFTPEELDRALQWYAGRARRFGRIDELKAGEENA